LQLLLRLGKPPWMWFPVEVRYRGKWRRLVEFQPSAGDLSFFGTGAPAERPRSGGCRSFGCEFSEKIIFSYSGFEVLLSLRETTQLGPRCRGPAITHRLEYSW